MDSRPRFTRRVLDLDMDREIAAICESIRKTVRQVLRRKGAVVAVSGGIDSSLCAALSIKALGSDRVLLLYLPERDSSPESLHLGMALAAALHGRAIREDISGVLEGFGCYERQLEAVRQVVPEFEDDWRFKVVLPPLLDAGRLNLSRLVVQRPDGSTRSERLPHDAYLQLVAATNFKQRTRKGMEYYHADRLNYAVCGTPNRLEYDQGFFVKGGDGLADFKPIAHLYKTQVFAMARALGVPEEICSRTPTTDTYSLPQTQEEFYFSMSHEILDLCLFAHNHGYAPAEVAPELGLTPDQVKRIYEDIEAKRRATLPLHIHSVLVQEVPEIRVHQGRQQE